jgi:hypothetical protein
MHEAIIKVCGECVWREVKCLLSVFQTQNIRKYEEYTLRQCFSTAGPRPGTGPQEILLEVVILVFLEFFMNKYFIVEIFWGE